MANDETMPIDIDDEADEVMSDQEWLDEVQSGLSSYKVLKPFYCKNKLLDSKKIELGLEVELYPDQAEFLRKTGHIE